MRRRFADFLIPLLLVALYFAAPAWAGGIDVFERDNVIALLEELGYETDGTPATIDQANVAITGGSISGITDLAVADGGTGASTAAGALSNLGAGTEDTLTVTGLTATTHVVGAATTAGALLKVSGGVLSAREGDDSADVPFNCGVLGVASINQTGGSNFAFGSRTTISATTNGVFAIAGTGVTGAPVTNVKMVTTSSGTLSGASFTFTGARPAGSIVVGVTLRVTTVITGATSFKVGDGVDDDRYGATLALSQGTTTSLASHTATPLEWIGSAAGDVVLTANGSNFTGGVVRISVHYLDLTAPGS